MSGHALMSGQTRYILVVDADWNERFTMSMLLQRFGYTVASSNSVSEGIEFLCVAPAVAIFADAGASGDDLAKRLKADARFRDVPLVMVAQEPDSELEARQRRGEFAGLLQSPLNPEVVYQVIQKVIEKGSRENIRIPTALRAELRDEYGSTEGYVTVLSQYGLFFRTMEPRPAHTSVGVTFSLGDGAVSVEASVLYIVSFEEGPFCEPGMGMKFVRIGPEDSALIRFFIHEQVGAGILSAGPGPTAGNA
jgi:CheY-like chemotaxis protein